MLSLSLSFSCAFWALPFLFLIPHPPLQFKHGIYLFLWTAFQGFFPALFCHKKIGSHTITAKRVCRDPLASCFTLFLLKPWFREGKGLPRSDLSFTSQINCHLLCEASPDAIGVIGTLFERIHQIYHSVVKAGHGITVNLKPGNLGLSPSFALTGVMALDNLF